MCAYISYYKLPYDVQQGSEDFVHAIAIVQYFDDDCSCIRRQVSLCVENSQKTSAQRAKSVGAAHRLQVSVQLIHQRHSSWHSDLLQASVADVVKALQHGSVRRSSTQH
jgi:hypothetical protein